MALERGGGSSGTGTPVNIPDAPSDGVLYGRKNDAWTQANAADTTFTPAGSIAAATVQAALVEVDGDVTAHVADAAAAHAASAVSVDSTSLTGTGTDLQTVLVEIDDLLDAHIADTSAAHAASAISADSSTLVGTGTTVQAVFEELDNAIVACETATSNHLADSADAHAASAITNTPAGAISATTVQAAINELDTEKQPIDADLTALAGLTSAADKGIQFTGAGTAGTYDLTAAGKALLDDANAAAQLVTLGVTSTAAELNALDGITATVTELNYTDGVTSAIQAQIDALVVGSNAYIHLRDEKADGTQGGASTSTTEHVRVLNTEVTDTNNLCSLASNQFTLTAGTYRILASAPCLGGGDHRAYLYNATGAVTLIQGENEYAGAVATETVQTRSWTRGQFTVAASQALELRHRIQTGVAVNGLGAVCNGSGVEVYAQVELWKVG